MRTFPLVTGLVLTAAIGVTACSSDSPDSTDSSKSTTTTAGLTGAPVALPGRVNNEGGKDINADGTTATVEVSAADFSFTPTFIKAAAGQKVTVKLENTGSVAHTFTLDALDIDRELAPGATADVQVIAPASGDAAFYCRFHKDAGMQGAFYIP